MFGGRTAGSGTLLNDLHALDLESMIWTHLTSKGDSPSPRIRHTLTYVDGFLYLLGGNGHNSFVRDSFWRYDIRLASWSLLPSVPANDEVIAGHTAAAVDAQGILVFGGCSSIFGRDRNLFLFDTVGGKWSIVDAENEIFTPATVPEDHAVTVITNENTNTTYFVFHGGISTSGVPNQLVVLKHKSDVFSWYIPIVRDVRIFAPPIELYKHDIVAMKTHLFFMGGSSQFSRESEELAKVGCCGIASYKPVTSATKISIITFKKDTPKGSCCTIL